MDVAEYLPMFIAESREHLEGLGLAVVRIEERPGDRATIDEIFRIAHSFKGMSATMGYDAVAELTHAMEDVFELLRQRRDGLDRDAVDVLMACIDALELSVDRIEAGDGEGLDPAPLAARLRALVREEAPTGAVHVVVGLAEDADMPAVRAFMVLGETAEHGTLERSEPDAEAIDGFAGRTIEVWVRTDEPDALLAAVRTVPDVADARIVVPEPPRVDASPSASSAPKAKPSAATVRVPAARLDDLLHAMGELVVQRTQVEVLAAQAEVPGLSQAMQDLTRCSHALQAIVMQVRMIPVEAVFLRFPRLVRDLSAKMGKQVDLILTGRDTELDRTVVDALGDPLVHLVRNSLDHALETPAEREAAGKPATGVLELSARQAGGNVIITVRDDGRGIDPVRVAHKAVERGIIAADEAASVDMARAIELLFAAGFSTADQTSDISGRGVGMDVVRSTLRGLGGNVVMLSEQGVGTTVQVRLPLTLAILPALLVESQTVPFAIPLERIERTVNLAEQTVRSVTGRRMLVLSDGVLPLTDLAAALGYEPAPEAAFVVIARGAEQRMALVVERLIGQHELVTRPLPAEAGSQSCLSGGAVLSDGTISLIVDCDALAETRAGHRLGSASRLPNAA